jgi:hypothetical protein
MKRHFPPDFADKIREIVNQYSPEGKGEISAILCGSHARTVPNGVAFGTGNRELACLSCQES